MASAADKLPFSVIAKPVGSRCNMRCNYCYYLEKGQFSTNEKQTRMSFSLLEKLIRQTIEANPGPVVSFTWHGGEPTLAGIDFFKKVVELEKKYLPLGWQVWNSLQTNGLLINDEWCRFLRDNRFDVGLSIDGDKITHDKNRHDRGGNGTYDRVKKAVLKLKAHGILPDLLCTVNSDSEKVPHEVYRALRELDTGWIQFIPIVVREEKGSIASVSATPHGYGKFLCTIFDEWITNDLGKLDVQLFAECSRVCAGGKAGVCFMAETCGRVLIAEEDGGIYSCDHFVDAEHRPGSLVSDRLDKMVNGETQIAFGLNKRDALTKECRSCPYISFCGGGCLKDRFSQSSDGEEGQYYLCGGLKVFFEHAVPMLSEAVSQSRNGKTPKQVMDYFTDKLS